MFLLILSFFKIVLFFHSTRRPLSWENRGRENFERINNDGLEQKKDCARVLSLQVTLRRAKKNRPLDSFNIPLAWQLVPTFSTQIKRTKRIPFANIVPNSVKIAQTQGTTFFNAVKKPTYHYETHRCSRSGPNMSVRHPRLKSSEYILLTNQNQYNSLRSLPYPTFAAAGTRPGYSRQTAACLEREKVSARLAGAFGGGGTKIWLLRAEALASKFGLLRMKGKAENGWWRWRCLSCDQHKWRTKRKKEEGC